MAHFEYLSKTPQSYRTGIYQSVHLENPASAYYTTAGANEGESSELFVGAPWGWVPVEYIDGWLDGPFHALGLLNPTLGQVSFAESDGDGGIDVASGLNENPLPTTPVLFPGQGMATDITTFQGEYPSPLETCNWSENATVGSPLIAQLTQAPAAGISATLKTPKGLIETSQNGNLCIVDANDYRTTDTVYGPAGLASLQSDNAVVLMPKAPLTPGVYTATILQPAQANISWSFSVVRPPTVVTTAMPRAVVGVSYRHALAGAGGARPYWWMLVNNSKLPPGLTLSATGEIDGTPTKAGAYSFSAYIISDALGEWANNSRLVAINVFSG
jgi:hypothetical protein